MAITPATYNITLQRRADYYVTLQFKDSNDAAIDLTGWTVSSQVWNEARSKKYADFSVEYTDREAGTVKISLSDTQTASFADTLYYDVLLTDSDGIKEYYLEGKITTAQGYTE